MNSQPPTAASTPHPDTKYGVCCRGLVEKMGRGMRKKIGPTLFLKPLSTQEITGFREFSRNIYSPEKLRTVRFTFFPLVMKLLFRRVVARTDTVLEPQSNRRSRQSPMQHREHFTGSRKVSLATPRR